MAKHKRFNYKTLNELKENIESLKIDIPLSEDLEILKKPVVLGNKTLPNTLAIHPMEGCDSTADGKPDKLTFRRYERFAAGGAGMLWVEATAVVPEGRANPRQLYICTENRDPFKQLFDHIIATAKKEYGEKYTPYTVLQLTHSGRYSKPAGVSRPVIPVNNPYLDTVLPKEYIVITDNELKQLEDRFVEAAVIAKEIGFDAVDIKSCHRYLNSELFSAFTRQGEYGGSFENRTRFLINIVDKIRDRLGDSIDITLRMNAYDAIPYPYGWGVDKNDYHKPDITEPVKLIKVLRNKGIKLVNISCGNPYYNPHVGRPYDAGPYIPPQHPLESIANMLNIIKQIQCGVPDVAIVSTGFSWLREFAPYVAAGGIKAGWFKIAGFGRQAFAYPDFARDILKYGKMKREKCCITCSGCTEIMRDGGQTGCVIKDAKVYSPIYKKGRKGKPPLKSDRVTEHI